MKKIGRAQCASKLIGTDVQLPTEIELLQLGDVIGRDGRSWKATNGEDIVKAFEEDSKLIPIDFEHSTEIKAPEGEPAPAVGWITSLSIKDGSIWGEVEWNNKGKEAIENKEYRYISPSFCYDKETNEVLYFTSVGLTNSPNLPLQALCRQANFKEDTMAEDTAEQQQLTKEEMRTVLCDYLGVPVETTDEELIEIIKRLYEEANKSEKIVDEAVADIVEGEATNSVARRLDRIEKVLNSFVQGVNEDKIHTLISTAVKDGKIAPCNKEHYIALCRKNGIEEVQKIIHNTKPTSIFDAVKYATNTAQKPTLTEDEKAMCRATGTSEEAFLKAKTMEGK